MFNSDIGERIAGLRRSKGMSQQELADAVHATQALIAKIETGKRKIQLDLLVQIADCLDADCHEILTGVSAGNRVASNELGLSDEAIDTLYAWKTGSGTLLDTYSKARLSFLSEMITCKDGAIILDLLRDYLHGTFDNAKHLPTSSFDTGVAIVGDYIPTEEIYFPLIESPDGIDGFCLSEDLVERALLLHVQDILAKWRENLKAIQIQEMADAMKQAKRQRTSNSEKGDD